MIEQHIEIIRLYQTPVNDPKQTEGHLYFMEDGKMIFECRTLELPWNENKTGISCIPVGVYKAKKRHTEHSQFKYEHLHLQEVEDRKWILMHAGNYHTQIRGCILPGTKLTDINNDGIRDVTNSRTTLEKILSLMKKDEINIHFKWR